MPIYRTTLPIEPRPALVYAKCHPKVVTERVKFVVRETPVSDQYFDEPPTVSQHWSESAYWSWDTGYVDEGHDGGLSVGTVPPSIPYNEFAEGLTFRKRAVAISNYSHSDCRYHRIEFLGTASEPLYFYRILDEHTGTETEEVVSYDTSVTYYFRCAYNEYGSVDNYITISGTDYYLADYEFR